MGPLAGVRMVEFDAIGPVPLCAMLFADMGADVVRIARHGGQAAYDDLGETILHRGRTNIALDLKSDEGREAALSLIGKADLLVEGLRPGVMERLGLGPDACLAHAPRLVYGRMTGWGQSGMFSARAGHDINYIAIAGALGAMGEEGRPPMPPLNLVGDYGGGTMFMTFGLLAALWEARRSGLGQVVDSAMCDAVPVLMSLVHALRQTGGWKDARESNMLDGGMPFYRCYACADGGFVAVGALEPQFFRQLLTGLGLDPERWPQMDRSLWPDMRGAFEQTFRSRTRDEWAAVFESTDACVSPVLTMAEAVEHPHNRSRSVFRQIDGFVHPAPAPRFSITPGSIRPPRDSSVNEVLERWNHSNPVREDE